MGASSQIWDYVPCFVDQNLLICIPFVIIINLNAVVIKVTSMGSVFFFIMCCNFICFFLTSLELKYQAT